MRPFAAWLKGMVDVACIWLKALIDQKVPFSRKQGPGPGFEAEGTPRPSWPEKDR